MYILLQNENHNKIQKQDNERCFFAEEWIV